MSRRGERAMTLQVDRAVSTRGPPSRSRQSNQWAVSRPTVDPLHACRRGGLDDRDDRDGYWADTGGAADAHAPAAYAPTAVPPEEEGHGRWAWASRKCVRTPLTRAGARHCLRKRGAEWIHLHGDSVVRDLFGALTDFLGLPTLSRDELKRRTNVLGERLLLAQDHTPAESEVRDRLIALET
jgi:hypothetical protein